MGCRKTCRGDVMKKDVMAKGNVKADGLEPKILVDDECMCWRSLSVRCDDQPTETKEKGYTGSTYEKVHIQLSYNPEKKLYNLKVGRKFSRGIKIISSMWFGERQFDAICDSLKIHKTNTEQLLKLAHRVQDNYETNEILFGHEISRTWEGRNRSEDALELLMDTIELVGLVKKCVAKDFVSNVEKIEKKIELIELRLKNIHSIFCDAERYFHELERWQTEFYGADQEEPHVDDKEEFNGDD